MHYFSTCLHGHAHALGGQKNVRSSESAGTSSGEPPDVGGRWEPESSARAASSLKD